MYTELLYLFRTVAATLPGIFKSWASDEQAHAELLASQWADLVQSFR